MVPPGERRFRSQVPRYGGTEPLGSGYARRVASEMAAVERSAGMEPGVRVSTLELFFDLVFVFTVTQLTAVLAADLTVPGVLRVLLMLGVILWMYGGYAWLTNAVAPTDEGRRALLFVGMAGFLAI